MVNFRSPTQSRRTKLLIDLPVMTYKLADEKYRICQKQQRKPLTDVIKFNLSIQSLPTQITTRILT